MASKGVKQIDENTEQLVYELINEVEIILRTVLSRYKLKNDEISRVEVKHSSEIGKLLEIDDIKSKDILSLIKIIKKIYDSCNDEEFKKCIVDIIDYEIKPNTFENLLKRLDE